MSDFESTYAAFYDFRAQGLEGDVDFYVEEARRAGPPVLEIGCGTGRVLIPTARAGLEIVGLDLSAAMLDVARGKVQALDPETRARITLVQGDMRVFNLGRRFRLVTIPYRAFLHLLTPEDQRQALACVRQHLEPGGRLALNFFDPRLETIAAHQTSLGSGLKMISEFIHPQTGRRWVVWDTRQYDLPSQRIDQYFVLEELDAGGQVLSKHYTPLSLRYVHRQEMHYLLEVCGFEIEALYGDFRGGPFRYGGEQVWLARLKK